MNAPVPRSPDGRLLPGAALNPNGQPRNDIAELRAKYRNRLPELFDRLFRLTQSSNERTQIAAISGLLDRLIGKPQVTIEATTTRVDVAALYLRAMQRANAETQSATSHIVPSADTIEEKANNISDK
jgi:hypothetical protein